MAITSLPYPTSPFSNLPVGKIIFVSTYATLKDANDAIIAGATAATLIIDAATTFTNNLTLSSLVTLTKANTGLITIPTGKTLTVPNPPLVGDQQLFVQASSTAHVVFGAAVNPINIAWFTGAAGTGADLTNAWTEAYNSYLANGGGSVVIPAGTWTYTAPLIMASNLIVQGRGQGVTIIKPASNGVVGFKHGENIWQVRLRDLSIRGTGKTGVSGYYGEGSGGTGLSSGQLYFENVEICDFDLNGFYLNSLSNSWEFSNFTFDSSCRLVNNGTSIIYNTANTKGTNHAYMGVAAGQWAGQIGASGPYKATGAHAGNANYGTQQIKQQIVTVAGGGLVAGVGTCVVTASGLVGSPLTVYVPLSLTDLASQANANAAYRNALVANPAISTFFNVGYLSSGIGSDVELVRLDAAADDATFNFTISTGTATGVTNNPATAATQLQAGSAPTPQPARGYRFYGASNPIEFDGITDEGFETFVQTENDDADSLISANNCLLQSRWLVNGTRTLKTTDCLMVNRVIRGSASHWSFYESDGDQVQNQQNFGGSIGYITWAGQQPSNFSQGGTLSNMGVLIRQTDNFVHQIEQTYPQVITHTAAINPWNPAASLRLANDNDLGASTHSSIEIGTTTGNVFYGYAAYRDNSGASGWPTDTLGWLQWVGNQAFAFCGINFNGLFRGLGFIATSTNVNAGVGYGPGAGAAVTQLTDKSTATPSINTKTGAITMNNAALADATNVTFTVTNTAVLADEVPIAIHKSAGTAGAYQITAHSPVAATSFKITVRNVSGGSLSEAIVIQFALVRGAIA